MLNPEKTRPVFNQVTPPSLGAGKSKGFGSEEENLRLGEEKRKGRKKGKKKEWGEKRKGRKKKGKKK